MDMRWVWIIGLVWGLMVGVASPVQAWGPGIHLELSLRLVGSGLLSGALLSLVQAHETAFHYGSVVADVVIGKELVPDEEHSHRWPVAARLGELAEGDRQTAFALGYWTHLAADTVAHNEFVPRQLARSATTRKGGHGYWELRAEGTVATSTWDRLGELLAGDFKDENRLLEQGIRKSPLPVPWSRRIQRMYLNLTGLSGWWWSVRVLERFSRFDLTDAEMDRYRERSLHCMVESLGDWSRRRMIVRRDPTGGSIDRAVCEVQDDKCLDWFDDQGLELDDETRFRDVKEMSE